MNRNDTVAPTSIDKHVPQYKKKTEQDQHLPLGALKSLSPYSSISLHFHSLIRATSGQLMSDYNKLICCLIAKTSAKAVTVIT